MATGDLEVLGSYRQLDCAEVVDLNLQARQARRVDRQGGLELRELRGLMTDPDIVPSAGETNLMIDLDAPATISH